VNKAALNDLSSANLCACARHLALPGTSSSPLCARSTTIVADRAMRQSGQCAKSAEPRSRPSLPSWMSTTSASEIAALAQAESGSCRYRTVLAAKKGHLIAVAFTLPRLLHRRQLRRHSTSRRKRSMIPATCKVCKALAICGAGCRAESLVANDSLSADDPLLSKDDVDYAVAEYRAYVRERKKEVQLPSTICINPRLRWRRESSGSACFIGNQCVGIFNSDTTDLLFGNLIYKPTSTADLMKTVSMQFLQDPCEKRILIEAHSGRLN
jgi:radical SAM protein with 4Fe4S-binding SPASM domain